MTRLLLAALALACVCSPATSATLGAPPNSTAPVVWVLVAGIGLGLSLGLGIAAMRLRNEVWRTLCFFGLAASMIFVVGPAMAISLEQAIPPYSARLDCSVLWLGIGAAVLVFAAPMGAAPDQHPV